MNDSEFSEPDDLTLFPPVMSQTVFIALLSIMTALTAVATLIFTIPIPQTEGYFNLGDSMVMLSGFLLGPLGGFIAGGFGSGLADLVVAPYFFPITLVVKGLEGALVGYFSQKVAASTFITLWDLIGLFFGALAMLLGYFSLEIIILSIPWQLAFIEMIPSNLIQVTGGAIVTIVVGPIVRRYLRDLAIE